VSHYEKAHALVEESLAMGSWQWMEKSIRESMVSGQAVEVDVDGRQLRVRAVGAELAVVFRVQATPDDEEFTRKAW